MKSRLRHSKLAVLAAATIILGATPALAHDGPATRSGSAMVHGHGLSSASFFRLSHFGGFGGHGGGWNDDQGRNGHDNGWGRGHDNGNGWGRGHDNGNGWGRGHDHGHGGGGGGWHGGGHPCSPG